VVETRINSILGIENPDVESVITNVGFGAGAGFFDQSIASNKGKVDSEFVERKDRKGVSTIVYLDSCGEQVKDIPGTQISVEKNKMGPPTGKRSISKYQEENLDELSQQPMLFRNI